MVAEQTFGEYLKQLRLNRRITLRTFADMISMDPANYSKIERGKLDMPQDKIKRDVLRRALQLETESYEWHELTRLAAISRGDIPPRVLTDEQLMSKLPALFRALEGDPINDSLLEELIAALRRE